MGLLTQRDKRSYERETTRNPLSVNKGFLLDPMVRSNGRSSCDETLSANHDGIPQASIATATAADVLLPGHDVRQAVAGDPNDTEKGYLVQLAQLHELGNARLRASENIFDRTLRAESAVTFGEFVQIGPAFAQRITDAQFVLDVKIGEECGLHVCLVGQRVHKVKEKVG